MSIASTSGTALVASGPWAAPFICGGASCRCGESQWRRLTVGEQVAQRPPAELLAPDPQQADEARRGGLRVGERVVGPAVADAEAVAEALETDRVAQPPDLGGEPGRVYVVRVQRSPDGARDQPGVERVGAVLDEHRPLHEAPEPLQNAAHRRCAVQCLTADAVNAPGVGVDAVVAVHERLEAEEMALQGERHRAELDQMMWRLSGRLAIEGDETKVVDQRVV